MAEAAESGARTGTGRQSAWRGGTAIALYYAVVFLVGLAVLSSRYQEPGEGAIAIDRGTYAPLAPIDAAPRDGGRAVALPHRCEVSGVTQCAALYRLSFTLDHAARGDWSVYVPTFSGGLKIWLNGVFLADSREFRTGVVIVQTEPLLVPVPNGLLRVGSNIIEIRLETHAPVRMGGFLDRVFVGPDTVLSAAYDLRYLLLKTLPQQLVAWQAALALAVLVVWIGRRGERMYLTLSIILGLGVLRDFALFISGEESANVLLRATNLTSLWQASLLPGLVAPLFGRPSPVPLRWTLAPPAAITALFVLSLVLAVLPPIRFGELWTVVALPWTIVMQGVAIWIVVEAAFCRRFVAARVLLGVLLLAAMLAGHDLLVFFGFLADQRVLLTRFSSPLVMTAISALLMWRFAMALNEVSGFNQVLRQEVSAAEAALHASFAREQARLRDAALESERLRLTRDLHDGLAGQLVSIVAQCELRGAGFGTVSTAARRALDDLRLVVASLADVGNDLALMLAKFREHIEPQLLAQGMELDWQMTPLPEIEELRSEHTLALFRILQEAVSNAVRHSGCRTVTIAMAAASRDYAVRIVVSDRGRGSAAIRAGGHGLVNMRRRAEALGAALTIESGSDGTCIMIDLPHALPALGAGGSGD